MEMRMERLGLLMAVPDAENAPPSPHNARRALAGENESLAGENDAMTFKSEQLAPPAGILAAARVLSGAEADTRRRRAQGQRDAELAAAFAVARMMGRRKRADETFMDFAAALEQIGDGHVIAEPFFVAAFVNGLDDEHTARLLRTTKPQDLRSAAKEAIWLRRSDGAVPNTNRQQAQARLDAPERTRERRSYSDTGTTASTATIASAKSDGNRSEMAATPNEDRGYGDRKDRKRARCSSDQARDRRFGLSCCFMCGQPGHYARECPQREIIQRGWTR